jgi:site-specific recombinase XerD
MVFWRDSNHKLAALLNEYLGELTFGPMFWNPNSTRIYPETVSKLVRRVRGKAGIRTKATSHSFRRSSATHMLRAGAPLSAVQDLLGHACMKSTEIYTKVYPKDLIKMHRAFHPREREKNLEFLEIGLISLK